MSHQSEWARARASARQNRKGYTEILKCHGVTGRGYMHCTEVVYCEIIGGRAFQIRASKGLPPKTNLRDHLGNVELSAVMLAEALAAKTIQAEQLIGNSACRRATALCARHVASIIKKIIN